MAPDYDAAMDEFLAGFAREDRDLSGIEDHYADDLVVSDWMAPGSGYDKAWLLNEFYAPIVESFPDVRFEVFDSIRDGNRILVCGFFSGTMEKDYWGFPAHGHRVRWEARDLYRFNEELKIDRIWYANDTLTVARQLGADVDDSRLW